jgi:RecJ-like exonuclease
MEISLEGFKENLPDKTIRELNDNEQICKNCSGLGLIYKDRFIKTCPDCFKGKVKVCKHCDKILGRGRWKCDCEGAKKEQQKETLENALKKKKKAKEVSMDYIIENDLQLFDDIDNRYIPDIDDTIDIDWAFATRVITLDLNAYHIMENASVELHESVTGSFDTEDYDKLQEVCDEINEKYKEYRTFYPDFSKWVDLSEFNK